MIYSSGDYESMGIFKGTFENGLRKHGKFTWADGSTCVGEWREDKRVRGTFCWPDGKIYEGGFHDNEMHGKGKLTYADGDVYDGEWAHGRRHGVGTLYEFSYRRDSIFRGCRYIDGKLQAKVTVVLGDGQTRVLNP